MQKLASMVLGLEKERPYVMSGEMPWGCFGDCYLART
jgi:hypothetical protein